MLTLITMLVTTNDALVVWSAYAHDGMMSMDSMAPMADMMAKQGVKNDGEVRVYDAGTEANTELCAHIPGPPCGNKGARVTDGAEGTVGPRGGILGVGDLQIVATSLHHGLELVTGNTRHFGRIPDLRIRPLRQAR